MVQNCFILKFHWYSAGYEASGSSTSNFGFASWLSNKMHLTQISVCMRAGATMLMTQISLGLMLVQVARMLMVFIGRKLGLVQQMLMFQILLGQVLGRATNAYTSNFIGQQAGYRSLIYIKFLW
jgi:hypothetical protein